MNQLQPDAVLPTLRPELTILPGIREVSGLRCWLLFDPLRHQYFQIDDKSHAILKHWHSGNAGELISKIKSHFVSLEDIESLVKFLWINALTVSPPTDNSFYTSNSANHKKGWLVRLLHCYLFFVLPLLRPDKFLRKTEPLSRIFFSRSWFTFVALIGLIGMYLTSRQWDQFVHTFMHFFSLQGVFYYVLALCFVKLAHEAGHAYSATRYGCRIKSMGIAFIVMFPVLYTDTTDSWKLTSKKQRLIICGAGVAVELALAAIATFIWACSSDGALRSAAFFIATTSWVMSLLINMNPLMRFDAYHFLSDALGVQNLQARSFAIGRWSLRKIMFGLSESVPELISKKWIYGLTIFAWATWVYRFFLFLGIALLVHHMFFRPFGSILAIVEILFFIVIPIMNELNQWKARKADIVTNPSSWVTLLAIICLMLLIFAPWQSTVRIPAVIDAAESSDIYAHANAQVANILVAQGDEVIQGQTLAVLTSQQLVNSHKTVAGEIKLREALLNRIAADDRDLEQRVVLESELRSLRQELSGFETQIERLIIKAPIAGVISWLNSGVHAQRWVGKDEHLIKISSNQGAKIRGFVEHSNLARIASGTSAVFVPEVPELEKLEGKVEFVEAANAEELNIAALASFYGGPIAVNKTEHRLEPLKSWYHLSINSENSPAITQQWRGTVLAKGQAESVATRVWRRMFHLLLREVVI